MNRRSIPMLAALAAVAMTATTTTEVGPTPPIPATPPRDRKGRPVYVPSPWGGIRYRPYDQNTSREEARRVKQAARAAS